MDNLFFKYGIIMVGVAVITMLMVFAYSAMNRTIVNKEEPVQEFSGTSQQIKNRLIDLCDYCTKNKVDKECFVLDFSFSDGGELCEGDYPKGIDSEDCISGTGVAKINSLDKNCSISLIKENVEQNPCLSCDDELCCNNKALTDGCFWHADGDTCITKDCAVQFSRDCMYVATQTCCEMLDWACLWSGGACVQK